MLLSARRIIVILALAYGCSPPPTRSDGGGEPKPFDSSVDAGADGGETQDAGAHDAGMADSGLVTDGGDELDAGDPCGCTAPATCNRSGTGCTFECAECSDEVPCPEAGICRATQDGVFPGLCVYPMAPACSSGPPPTRVVLDVISDGCASPLVQAPSWCHRRHVLDLGIGSISITFSYEPKTAGDGGTVFYGNFAADSEIRAAWENAADGGLWCTSFQLEQELCATHQPYVTVSIEGSDAGHEFGYGLGNGKRPPPAVQAALDSLFAAGRAHWEDAGVDVVWP